MPTYEYFCEKCGHEFDVFQAISAKPLRLCPEDHCPRKNWGRGRVKRKISAGAGILFKGSGFYITDYRSEGYKQAAKKDSPSEKQPGSEAKPAAKSQEKSAKAKPAKA